MMLKSVVDYGFFILKRLFYHIVKEQMMKFPMIIDIELWCCSATNNVGMSLHCLDGLY